MQLDLKPSIFMSFSWYTMSQLGKRQTTMRHEFIVAIFPSRTVLTKALDYITSLEDIKIHRAAIVARANNGEAIVIGDTISADEGAIAGGTLGAAMTALGLAQLGALALPGIGIIIAFGAAVLVGGLVGGATGRFAANLLESGFKSDQIDALAKELQAGHPALILEVPSGEATLALLREELKAYRAEVVERLSDGWTSSQVASTR
jgi:uncharacterized membrane protein